MRWLSESAQVRSGELTPSAACANNFSHIVRGTVRCSEGGNIFKHYVRRNTAQEDTTQGDTTQEETAKEDITQEETANEEREVGERGP